MPLAREAGLRGLWLGIEDLTAGLVKKGQTIEKTKVLFKLLLKQGISPMPMMMHHDGQPLWTWRGLYGLLNQVRFLWKAGAPTCQVTLLTPWVGSQGYEQPFRDGLVLSKVGGQPIEQYQYDGNHCLATSDAYPWRRQVNMLAQLRRVLQPDQPAACLTAIRQGVGRSSRCSRCWGWSDWPSRSTTPATGSSG